MIIGIPAETKNNEFRVAATPAGVAEMVAHGHTVLIEAGAGAGSSFADAEYLAAGARIVETAAEVWGSAETVVKVKEPVASEYGYLRADLTLFTYLHLAADLPLTQALVESGCTAIGYETVQRADGSLPLLAPMSEVAGRMSVAVGAASLLAPAGGRGVLLGGVPGTPKAKVVVLGGGVAGTHAAEMAVGMGAQVSVIDVNLDRLAALDAQFAGRIATLGSNRHVVADALADADLVIGSVLVPGAATPKLVTDDMVATMKSGAVLVDIAIDQGGCFEGSHPTTHDAPTFPVHDALYYCVANMPGAVPRTSTVALTNATLRYVLTLADLGAAGAMASDAALAAGLNVADGQIHNSGVARAHGLTLAA